MSDLPDKLQKQIVIRVNPKLADVLNKARSRVRAKSPYPLTMNQTDYILAESSFDKLFSEPKNTEVKHGSKYGKRVIFKL
jgi:hypothetical protein